MAIGVERHLNAGMPHAGPHGFRREFQAAICLPVYAPSGEPVPHRQLGSNQFRMQAALDDILVPLGVPLPVWKDRVDITRETGQAPFAKRIHYQA